MKCNVQITVHRAFKYGKTSAADFTTNLSMLCIFMQVAKAYM